MRRGTCRRWRRCRPTRNATKHIDLWIAEFGARARHTITTADVDAVLSRWLNAKLSPSTVRNRRTALHAPVEPPGRSRRAEPRPAGAEARAARAEARAISYEQIPAILAAMPDVGQGLAGKARDDASKTKARLAVIAFTGLPHSLVKRLTPEAVNWQLGTIDGSPAAQGQGREGADAKLTDAGLAGAPTLRGPRVLGDLQQFEYDQELPSGLYRRRGSQGSRVYDLRHSYATEMYRRRAIRRQPPRC